MIHTPVVVLGGGPGGYAAAFLAADLGLNVTLVETFTHLGGTCLLRGCIPSKALLHAAMVIEEAKHAAEWGFEFKTPSIHIDTVRHKKDTIIKTLSGGLSELAKKRSVRVITARGVFVDSHTLQLEDGLPETYAESNRLTFDHCILATGSTPTWPEFLKLPNRRMMDSTGALGLADIPDTLLVIGGGYIGLEMGTVYARMGSKVSVVEMLPELLSMADRDLVRPLQKRLGELFEAIHLKTKVTAVADKGQSIGVTLEGDAISGEHDFDRVLVSIGRRPHSRGFGLENTNVQIDEHGFVQVDAQQRTDDEAIFAIGDVVGQPMLAHKASYEAKIAAEVLAGQSAVNDARAIPAVIFTDPELAWAGLTEAEAKAANRNVEVVKYPWAASGRAHAMGRTEGLTKWIIDPSTERVLGAGIVGYGAGELIAEATLAIEMGATAGDLAGTIHAHPTMAETLHFAAEAFYGTATEIYRPKKR